MTFKDFLEGGLNEKKCDEGLGVNDDDENEDEEDEELTESVISKLETAAGKSLRPGEANIGGIDVVLLDAGDGDVDIEVGEKADLKKLSSWLRKNKFKFTKEDDWTVSITS